MDIITMARELGKALQQDERYLRLQIARQHNDEDAVLQDLIGKFNLRRMELNQLISSKEKDQQAVARLDGEIKSLYHAIMENEHMHAFEQAKGEVDQLMNFINQILMGSINGEDPDTIEESASCGGNCEGCSGCH